MSVKGKKTKDKKLTVEELHDRLSALMEYCIENTSAPSDYAVMKHVGISPDTLERWRKDQIEDENGKLIDSPYAVEIKKFDLFRNDFWLSVGLKNPKLQGFVAFNLKQPCNGGYSDKQGGSGGAQVEVTIKTAGIGGDDAFK